MDINLIEHINGRRSAMTRLSRSRNISWFDLHLQINAYICHVYPFPYIDDVWVDNNGNTNNDYEYVIVAFRWGLPSSFKPSSL